MANELSLSGLTVVFAKTGSPSVSFTAGTVTVTVSGTQIMDNVQSVGTSEEAILLGDVATGGYWLVQNLDTTNYVEIRSGTGATDLLRLNAGEIALFRTSSDSSAPFAIANTGAVNVRFLMFDA